MRRSNLPRWGPGPELSSEPNSRGGGRSLLSLLRAYSLSSLLCSLVTTPLSFLVWNPAMSSSFWALAAMAALLPISILPIWASRSKLQIFLLRYTIHRQMSSGLSAPGGSLGGSPPGGPPGGPLSGGPLYGGPLGGAPPAILQVVHRLRIQLVHHPGVLRCWTGRHLHRAPCRRRCPCPPIGARILAGVGRACFPYYNREVGDPLNPNSGGCCPLLRHQLQPLPLCSLWAHCEAGGLVHPHGCR